jgi:hypothetical protein
MGQYRKELEKQVKAIFEEWQRSVLSFPKEIENARDMLNFHIIPGYDGRANYLNRQGFEHFCRAARLLLAELQLQRRVSINTAKRHLGASLGYEIERAFKTHRLSETAVIGRAKQNLQSLRWSDGAYIFPAVFAPQAVATDFRIGCARIISKDILLDEKRETLVREKTERSDDPFKVVDRWENYIQRYDHFIVIEMKGFEWDMAWTAARETAEYVLNIFRMSFTYGATKWMKLAGESIWDETWTAVMIGADDAISYQTQQGPWGSHLHDGWVQTFDEWEGRYSWLFAGYLDLITGHNIPESPITLRILYASRLIAEAYCEPHDHMRLVRLISALETLAVLEGEKSEELARRCGLAGGWSSNEYRQEIEAAVTEAYKRRNAIVHGDPEAMQDYQTAFLKLENNLSRIFIGFSLLYIGIHESEKPRHVKELRRAMKKKIEPFFHDAATARNLPEEAHANVKEEMHVSQAIS